MSQMKVRGRERGREERNGKKGQRVIEGKGVGERRKERERSCNIIFVSF